ncbi:MAG: NAD(P)/FAD-dependent oxidoreductase [Zetaproteobacteria bacterium]|nr:MAG: NAD(P)/FAD-dependent oxidoreductase [Zetaproteobacteria bacterium]
MQRRVCGGRGSAFPDRVHAPEAQHLAAHPRTPLPMKSYEVLIVGGGPAGSSCAWFLAQHGIQVAVLDARKFPRDKVCAGWITPAALALRGASAADYPHLIQPIRRFRIGLIHGPVHHFSYPEPVSYGIRRCEFDHWLLEQAGVPVHAPEPVRTIERCGARWRINDRFEARMLVGAGGHFCPVARRLGARPGRGETTVYAQEAEFPIPKHWRAHRLPEPDQPELYFCPDLAGYGWIFRKGDYLNVGLGRVGGTRLASHVQAFVDWLIASGRLPEAPPVPFRGHAYLLAKHAKRPLIGDGALLVGDAAGLADNMSGEGIRPAIASGILAARTILEASGDYSRARLAPYAERITALRGKALPAPTWLARLGFHFGPVVRRFVLEKGFLGGKPAEEAKLL